MRRAPACSLEERRRYLDSLRLRGRTAMPAAALLLITAALMLTKTGRDALYIQQDGVRALPLAYIGIAAASPPAAIAVLTLMKRTGPRTARVALCGLTAAVQATAVFWAEPGAGPLMTLTFIMVPVTYGILLASGWLLAGELVTGSSEARAKSFGILAAATTAGGACGALTGRLVADMLAPNRLFLLGAGALSMAATVIAWAQRRFPPARPFNPNAPTAMPPLRTVAAAFKDSYIRILAAVAAGASILGVWIEFLFYTSAGESYADASAASSFFASFYLGLSVASLILQFVLRPLLQRHLGVSGTLLILPAIITGGSLLFTAHAITPWLLRLTEGGLKSSIHRASWEQTYQLVGEQERDLVKIVVEGITTRMGEGLAAAAALFWFQFAAHSPAAGVSAIRWFGLLMAAGGLVWVAAAVLMRRQIQKYEYCVSHESPPDAIHPADGCVLTATLGRRLLATGVEDSSEGEVDSQ